MSESAFRAGGNPEGSFKAGGTDVTVFECWYVLLAREFRRRAMGESLDDTVPPLPFRRVPMSAPTSAPHSMGSWWSPDADSHTTLWVIWRQR